MKISIVLPAYNEEKNINLIYKKISETFKNLEDLDYEIIFINDGSTDKTKDELDKIKDGKVVIISFDERIGKAFALFTGIKNAKNNIVATLDSDLQDEPGEIPRLLERLNEGYDLVCGWRHKRNDNFIKRISTKIGNYINNTLLNIGLHDNNCPLKVFKKECIENMIVFEHWHRFIPVLTKMQGYNVTEEKVEHYPRIHGKTKYGIRNRVFGNLKSLFIIRFRPGKVIKNLN